MNAIIETKFTMDFTPDKDGKITTTVSFSFPDLPGHQVPGDIRKIVIEEVGELCESLKLRPEAFSAEQP